METEPRRVKLDMLCGCGPDDLAEANSVRAWAKQAVDADDGNFVSRAAFRISAEYELELSFWADQWFMVSAWSDELRVNVECDRVEDGVAAIFMWCREPEGVGRK